jgi:di-trans,poly-cis-decaprenylcistransferase
MKYEEMTDKSNIPTHIAIIMDGNGRWAKKRLMPRSVGHKAGADMLKRIVRKCNDMGVKYLTVYAFSTENWKRPDEEVSLLMGLIVTYLQKEVKEMNENNVRIGAIGDIEKLPKKAYDELKKAMEITKNNTGVVFSLALNYGFRDDLSHAIKNMMKENINIEDINDETVKKYLYTSYMPDPDLIIRTGGEIRLSNFMLYEASYSEFYFCDTLWPEFDEEQLCKAIYEYQQRDRRFGNVK